MRTTYPSLNLAQSVMLYAWELSGLPAAAGDVSPAGEDGLAALRQRLERLLPALDTPREGKLAHWLFERLPLLSQRDIGFVHTLCGQRRAGVAPKIAIPGNGRGEKRPGTPPAARRRSPEQ